MVELLYSIYKGRDNTLFLVSPDKIVIQTKLQEYYLLAEEYDPGDKLDMISYFIQTGKINDMGSLRRRIKGIFWLQNTHKRHEVMEKI